jgi:hypothetical protein
MLLINGNTKDITKNVNGRFWGKVTLSYFSQIFNSYNADINKKNGGGKFTII